MSRRLTLFVDFELSLRCAALRARGLTGVYYSTPTLFLGCFLILVCVKV